LRLKEYSVGKLIGGFIFGFLACVWAYGLDPTEAIVIFGGKLAAAHEHLEAEYRVDPRYGHKGQYSNHNRSLNGHLAPEQQSAAGDLAYPRIYWLTRQMGGPPMM
jgi:hypothetical protein